VHRARGNECIASPFDTPDLTTDGNLYAFWKERHLMRRINA